MALSSAVLGQQGLAQQAAGEPPAHKPKSAATYNKHPPIQELDPFAETIVFTGREYRPRLQSFALNEVQLTAGPLADARTWNRDYMMRLPNDSLLHNFSGDGGVTLNSYAIGRMGRANVRAARALRRSLSLGLRFALCLHRGRSGEGQSR
jgi:hypothetical protein